MPPNQPQQLDQFEILRRRARQQGRTAQQEGRDALRRRFASLGQGALQSGAAIKAEQLAGQEAQKATNQAVANVDVAEAQELQRRKEVQEQRDFQSTEALKQREFATGERLGGQQFQQGIFDREQAFKTKVFDTNTRFQELDRSFRDKEFKANLQQNQIAQAMNVIKLGLADDPTLVNLAFNRLKQIGAIVDFDKDGNLILN